MLLSPQGLLANSRRSRLLPKGPDWHFHSFCAALKPVIVTNLPPHGFSVTLSQCLLAEKKSQVS